MPMLSGYLIAVDVHVYTPEEVVENVAEPFSFVRSILKSGKTIFEKKEMPNLGSKG